MNVEIKPIPFSTEGPQPLLRPIAKGEAYPVAALGPLEAAVRAVQDKTQAPVAITAQSALSVASLAVQGFADVETLGGTAPTSLFCLTVAASGERKSGCDKLLLAGLREFEQDAHKAYGEALEVFQAEKRLWDAREKKLLGKAANGGATGDKAATELRALPSAPLPPLYPIRTATEPTFEGLVKLFEVASPALGLFTDEGGSFFGGHAMNTDNKLKTMAGLSSLWDGTPINRTRAGDGASTLYGRRLAAHMMVQPVAIRPLLADPVANGQGFLARFLITEPESNIGYRAFAEAKPQSDSDLLAFKAKLISVLAADLPLQDGTRNQLAPTRLRLTSEAKALLRGYYDATEYAQRPEGDLAMVKSYASKSAEQAARIAGVLALWADLAVTEISASCMANGIELAQYYLGEARRLAGMAVISADIDQAEKLRLWLIEKWGKPEITPSDVVQYGPYALRESPKAKASLDLLAKHGWLTTLPANHVVEGKARKLAYRVERGQDVV